MKKTTLLIILFSLLLEINSSYSQLSTDDQLMMKYWYYRNRLLNDFMIGVGNDFGQSIPAGERGEGTDQILHFGDSPINLTYYIAVLVTEFNILNAAHQNTDQTIIELFYAINAINRMDYYTESYYRGNHTINSATDFNGFFVRDDVGNGLLTAYHTTNAAGDAVLTHLNNGDPAHPLINKIESDWSGMWFNPGGTTDIKNEMSKDHLIHIFVALSMVVEGLSSGVAYSGHTFMDGESTFVQEAKNITHRILDRIHSPSSNVSSFHMDIINPVTGNHVKWGWNLFTMALGYSKTYSKITGEHNPTTWVTITDPDWWLAKATFLLSYQFFPAWTIFEKGEGLKILNLVTTGGDCCSSNRFQNLMYSYLWSDWPSDQIPLLDQYLNGGNSILPNAFYDALLGAAPCYGPYNLGGGSYQNSEWSSTSLTIHPNKRGEDSPSPSGQFNGLDYMFLYNLYITTHHSLWIHQDNYYINSYNTNVTHDFPYTYNNLFYPDVTFGDQSNPLLIASYNTINAANTIHYDADLTYRAGNEINFNAGFNVEAGSKFLAYIDPVDCISGSGYYRNTNASLSSPIHEKPQNDNMNKQIEFSAFPIPSNQNLNFRISLPQSGDFDLSIYNLYGQKIVSIYKNSNQQAGVFFLTYNSFELSNGIYICKMRINKMEKSIKFTKTN